MASPVASSEREILPLPTNTMTLRRNRYVPALLLAQLDGQIPSRDGDEWCLRFTCPDEQKDLDEFLAYLPQSQLEQPRAITVVRDFLSQISKLDNLVQDSCEEEWARAHSTSPTTCSTLRISRPKTIKFPWNTLEQL